MLQQVLVIETERPNLRAPAQGWTCEDPREVKTFEHVGLSMCARFPHTYDCVLFALADGWCLLGPPQVVSDTVTVWWLGRMVAVGGA